MEYLFIDLSKGITQKECAKANFKENVHLTRTQKNFELFLITEGELSMQQNGKEILLKKGDVFIAKPNLPYGGVKPSTCKFFWSHFFVEDYKISSELKKSSENVLVIPLHFNIYNFSSLVVTFSLLSQQVLEKHSFASQKIRDSLLTAILAELSLKSTENPSYNDGNSRFLQIVEYLMSSANLQEFKSIKEMAEFFGYNEKYIIRLFKQNLNVSPLQFVTNRKIDIAKEMLVNPELTVENIALTLDFDYQYFLKLFKKKVGLTPTEFRKAICPNWHHWIDNKKEK